MTIMMKSLQPSKLQTRGKMVASWYRRSVLVMVVQMIMTMTTNVRGTTSSSMNHSISSLNNDQVERAESEGGGGLTSKITLASVTTSTSARAGRGAVVAIGGDETILFSTNSENDGYTALSSNDDNSRRRGQEGNGGSSYVSTTVPAMTIADIVDTIPTNKDTITTVLDTTNSSIVSTLFQPIRINAGGITPIVDDFGHVWNTDDTYVVGNGSSSGNKYDVCQMPPPISSSNSTDKYTVPWAIGCSERYFTTSLAQQQPYQYSIPVPGGRTYTIRLYFVEIYHTTIGQRMFDVLVNNEIAIQNLDVIRETGGIYRVYDTSITSVPSIANVTNNTDNHGTINIQFVPIFDFPKVSAIEITEFVPTPSIAPTTPTVVASSFRPILLNAGGTGAIKDKLGRIWIADNATLFTNGSSTGQKHDICPFDKTTTALILNNTTVGVVVPTEIFCSERYFNKYAHSGPYRYSIVIPEYSSPSSTTDRVIVRLYFAEIYHDTPGKRSFDVLIQGNLIAEEFDIIVEAGGKYRPFTLTSDPIYVNDTGGIITIEFIPGLDFPKISGIEISEYFATSQPTIAPIQTKVPIAIDSPSLTVAPTPSTPIFTPIRINAGGPALPNNIMKDKYGRVWYSDNSTVLSKYPGQKYDSCDQSTNRFSFNSTIDIPPELLCSERYFNTAVKPGPYGYNITFPPSTKKPPAMLFRVLLYFAEIYHTLPGQRVFDVYVENELIHKNFDIIAQAGGNFRVCRLVTGPIAIVDNVLTIEFVAIKDFPKISAIEVIEYIETASPTITPTISRKPTARPTISLAPTAERPFQYLLISCGNTVSDIVDWQGREWLAEKAPNKIYHEGGSYTFANKWATVTNTQDPDLYRSERYGIFKYEIPLALAHYEVILHFAEIFHTKTGDRIFNVRVEEKVFENIDIIALAGAPGKAMTLETAQIITDGSLTIELYEGAKSTGGPKISAIEVKLVGPHYAHSVANGPYKAVDMQGTGLGKVKVDGSKSHTHRPGAKLNRFLWKLGSKTLAEGEEPTLTLPVGEHTVTLQVFDDLGSEASEATTVTIFPFGYPAVASIEPNSGSIKGGDEVTIRGSGFVATNPADIIVHFGLNALSGADIRIVDSSTIIVLSSPPTILGIPAPVSVQTPKETSNTVPFTYIAASPIQFEQGILASHTGAAVARFGPDRKLYVGTLGGLLTKYTLDETYTLVVSFISSLVTQFRPILGISFDPMETNPANPSVFVSNSHFFHNEWKSSSGEAINGKITVVKGANLDIFEDIITGLPISDHDHGINGLEFGDKGELYINIGSNTNGGIPGQLTGSQLQKENVLSAAMLVAYLSDPDFNGFIKYDNEDDGNIVGGNGVEVFGAGLRNPFGLTLHSNGYMYATDNGPNYGYGDMRTGCGPNDLIPDEQESDKIVLVEKGKYYGHPNHKRGEKDQRQCKWRSAKEPSDVDFTAPLLTAPSSMTGIVEFASNHFDGQLRYNLIACKYTDGLFRAVLTNDGRGVIPESDPIVAMDGDWGLDVTQAPNGVLIQTRLGADEIAYFKPLEQESTQFLVKSVFPKRGGEVGGNMLDVYGTNFNKGGILDELAVLVGGKPCPIVSKSSTLIVCIVPGGVPGTVDVQVTKGSEISIFERGYRYITGRSKASDTTAPATAAPTFQPVSGAPTLTSFAAVPTLQPVTAAPTLQPVTSAPSFQPVTEAPTLKPVTAAPTLKPVTAAPTLKPVTAAPVTAAPTIKPVTPAPTLKPVTPAPTLKPVTPAPTLKPVTPAPTLKPVTPAPTLKPVARVPIKTNAPQKKPTRKPTRRPTQKPTRKPTRRPVVRPTRKPTRRPVVRPTRKPVTRRFSSPTRFTSPIRV